MRKTFNSGVFVTELSHWGHNVFSGLHQYMNWDASSGYKLFVLGDEPLLNLVFKDFLPLDLRWNHCGYGNVRLLARLLNQRRGARFIIHWSGGHHKPRHGPKVILSELWRPYDILPEFGPQ